MIVRYLNMEKFKKISLSTIGNVVGRSVNIILPLCIIKQFGVTHQSDTLLFYLAMAQYCTVSISNSFTDAGVSILGKGGSFGDRGYHFLLLLAFALAPVVFILPSKYFQGEVLNVALVFLIGFVGLVSARLSAALLLRHSYALPGLTWLYRIIPLLIILFHESGDSLIVSVLIGVVIADLLRCFHLWFRCPASASDYRNKDLKSIFLIVMLIAGPLVFGLNPIIDRYIASLCEPGAVSILEAAERSYGIFSVALSIGLATVSLVEFSLVGSLHEKRKALTSNIRISILFGLSGVVCGLVAWFVIKPYVLGSGIEKTAIDQIQKSYFVLLVSLPMFLVGLVSVKLLLAEQRNRLILIYSVLGVIINLVSSLVFAQYFGVVGVVMGTFLMSTINSALVTFSAYRALRVRVLKNE